ncbi:MAG: hypothetical protein V2J24_01310 [Pseudomonadales bacterium]|jgi:hypothetical protein|nr:hypothetical protein [Pseudomonadales bacterium]
MIRRARIWLALLLLPFAWPAIAADIYVRNDGHDVNCDGLADAPCSGCSIGSTCAKRTLSTAYTLANCGDRILIDGDSFGAQRPVWSKSCTSGSPLTIQGEGDGTTFLHAGGVEVTGCTLISGAVYSCPIPTFGLASTTTRHTCMAQDLSSGVAWEDENGVNDTMAGFACLTWHDATSTVDTTPGSWTIDGSNYRVRLWNDENPATSTLWAPRSTCTNQYSTQFTGDHHILADLTMTSACEVGVYLGGTNNTIEDVTAITGQLDNPGSGNDLTRVTIGNVLKRPFNGTGTSGTAWDNSVGYTQSITTTGDNFIYTDLVAKNARESVSFSGNANNGRMTGGKISGHFNHGWKLIDTAHDITFENVVSWNNQESILISGCVYNITFKHCTFEHQIYWQGNSAGADCSSRPVAQSLDGPYNVDMFGNVIYSFLWLGTFGDPRAGAFDHDFDYNVYIGDTDHSGYSGAVGDWMRFTAQDQNFSDITAWRNWASDPCTNCTRDPNGGEAPTTAAEWVARSWRNPTSDVHLMSTAFSRDFTDGAYMPVGGKDADGFARDATPDAGAYEYNGNPQCSDGIDNDGDGLTDFSGGDTGCTDANDTDERECGDGYLDSNEACDPGPPLQLGGESCSSQGFGGGTLGCTVSCTLDTSGCTGTPPASGTALKGVTIRGVAVK